MSEFIRARVLLAKMSTDTEPSVVAAVDESIWEHWTPDEEAAWIAAGKLVWGIEVDTEFKVVVARFAPKALTDAFTTPEVSGEVGEETETAPSPFVCKCGHGAHNHVMFSQQQRCEATVYTDAPIGGGSAYPCPCRQFDEATP